jgi:hypothetical protein
LCKKAFPKWSLKNIKKDIEQNLKPAESGQSFNRFKQLIYATWKILEFRGNNLV